MATVEELQADRAAIAAARLTFLTTGAVKQVTRSGRTLIMQTASLADFDAALARMDADIEALTAQTCGTRRRRALSVNFG